MKPEVPSCACRFDDREQEREARMQFLQDYGNQLPEKVVKDMVDDFWDKWTVKCSCDSPKQIISAGHWEQSDWFLCAIKGLAVREKLRSRGLGREVTAEVVERAMATKAKEGNYTCLVLAADVTYDNEPSLRLLRRAGFEHVGEFCWAKGEKPADILHLVRFRPTGDKSCLEP